MLAEKDVIPITQGDGILQMSPHSQRTGEILPHVHRQGRVSPRSADHHGLSMHFTDDRIIHMADNRAVVHQEKVGDSREALQGFVFINADRFVGQIPLVATTGEFSSCRSR